MWTNRDDIAKLSPVFAELLFVCELYSNSNVFTRLLFTRYKAKLNIHVGRTIFKTKLDLSSVLNKVITSMPGPAMQKPATGKTTSPEQDFPSTYYIP
jgi:hypothetical protein